MLDGFKRKNEIKRHHDEGGAKKVVEYAIENCNKGCMKKAAKYVVAAIVLYYAAKGCMGCTSETNAMYKPKTQVEELRPKYDTIDDLAIKGADVYARK